MNRRVKSILLPLAAASVLAGCATFDDSIASVDGTALEQSELDELLAIFPNSTQSGPADPDAADDVRFAISLWIRGRLVGEAYERAGSEITPVETEAAIAQLAQQFPDLDSLSDEARQTLVNLSVGEPVSQELLDRYALGPAESGLICVSHILTEDVASADDVKARLDDGGDFAEIAAEESIDPGSGAAGGDLGCFDVGGFQAQFIPEFVDGALAAEPGEPTDPVESQFGSHVILVRTAENAGGALRQFEEPDADIFDDFDVAVSSRYGTFDPTVGVVPLG